MVESGNRVLEEKEEDKNDIWKLGSIFRQISRKRTSSGGRGTSISDVNGLDIPKQNEAVHPKKSRRAASTSKTERMREKIKQLRKTFKLLDETKPKGKMG